MSGALAEPLDVLLETAAGVSVELPAELTALYGGALALDRECVFANFVSSLDGVVAIPSLTQSSALIGDRSEADRFVMGILRACSEAVLIGSGTLRGSPTSLWTAERVYPPAAPWFAKLRERLAIAPSPLLALLTASGEVDVGHPALVEGALVLTTTSGASRLEGRLPGQSEVVVLDGDDEVDVRAAIDALHVRGYGRILSEAGPTVTGSLLGAGVLDELFLTLSPLVAGRAGERRPGFVDRRELLPEVRVAGRLTSVRRHGGHLFLRYRLE